MARNCNCTGKFEDFKNNKILASEVVSSKVNVYLIVLIMYKVMIILNFVDTSKILHKKFVKLAIILKCY